MNKYQESLNRIQKAIKEKYATQKAFAKASGIKESTLSRYLQEVRKLSLENFMKICEAIGKSPNEILGWKDE